MANTQRSLEEAFPDRFLLGLGVSHHHLVDRVRHHDYSRPYSYMSTFLDDMDKAVFRAVGPEQRPATVLAALGPKMLRLSAEKADGAHPYFVPVEHTAQAREILGPDPILAPEQMVVLDTNRDTALATARAGMSVYLRAPNYVNNLKRYGFTDDDLADGPSERLVEAIVAMGDVQAVMDRVNAHFAAGASHVCVQVLEPDQRTVPEGAWRELGAAVTESSNT
jgi:probable F420-dependent oxidoreductase